MSASPFPEPLDAPMHDFAEFDVPMNSVSQDFFLELSMDHDGHSTTYINQEGVEVDMETYDDGNVEYEMADETEEFNEIHHQHELLDVEVYDASDLHSSHPAPDSQTLPSLAANPEISLLSSPTPLSETFPPQAGTTPVEQSVADRQEENDSSVAEQSTLSHQQEDASLAVTPEQLPEPEPSHTTATNLAGADSYAPPTVDPHDVEKPPIPLVSGMNNEAGSSVKPAEAESTLQPQAEEQSREQLELPHRSDAPSETSLQVHGENHAEIHHEEVDDTNDPHEISEGVYIDPPPAVFVSIGSSDVPEYCLFNQPPTDRGSRSPSAEATGSSREGYSLLLQNQPTLYYEPLSCVFEALRQDDIIAKIPDALEAELVIDAYDLQLTVSEDNIYAHEISLHDLNVLHDGSDFTGPLRIHLRSAIPRFILRYRLLQEQISRLDLAAGAVEESLEGHDRAEHHDDGHGLDHHNEELQHEASTPDEQKNVSETEGVYQSEVRPDQPQDEEEPATTDINADATFIPQAFEDTSQHSISDKATQALEEEGDYEDTNTGTEPEDGEGTLDAAAVYDTADTDATAAISNEHSQFRGGETEYLDYVQPEEYDERYEEDFPEEFAYNQTVGYSESGDTSTPVDESKAVLPGLIPSEADATPVPPAQLGSSTPTQSSETADSGQYKHVDRLVSHEPLQAKGSHHTDKVLTVGQQEDQHQSMLQLPTDESDSNFLAMLERDVDSELDRFSNSNVKHIEKGVVEEIPPVLEEWDEWDDELDADGEADEEWLDPGDAVSNESSVTLSSSSSGKRGHDEVEPEEPEVEASTSRSSPGKRPRNY